jgi:hypothetical protein
VGQQIAALRRDNRGLDGVQSGRVCRHRARNDHICVRDVAREGVNGWCRCAVSCWPAKDAHVTKPVKRKRRRVLLSARGASSVIQVKLRRAQE